MFLLATQKEKPPAHTCNEIFRPPTTCAPSTSTGWRQATAIQHLCSRLLVDLMAPRPAEGRWGELAVVLSLVCERVSLLVKCKDLLAERTCGHGHFRTALTLLFKYAFGCT
jgi:hypothetical protein